VQNYSELPVGLQDGMQRYVEDGILPGDFLTAVLENDLKTAVFRADDNNIKLIPEIVKWVYWEIPNPAWGSPKDVKEWTTKFAKPSENIDGR